MKMMGLSNTIGHFICSKIFSLFLTSDEANIESMLMLLKWHMLKILYWVWIGQIILYGMLGWERKKVWVEYDVNYYNGHFTIKFTSCKYISFSNVVSNVG